MDGILSFRHYGRMYFAKSKRYPFYAFRFSNLFILFDRVYLAEKNPLLGDMGAFPPAPINGDTKTVQVNVNALYAESDYDSAESRDYSMQ